MPQVNNWYVYILECSDGTLYTGSTNNVERRIKQHGTKYGAKYTRYRSPVKLLAYWEFINKTMAYKEEYRIKQLKRVEKLNLIKNKVYFDNSK